MSISDQELAYLVDRLARRYARRCWWADEEDLRQVAWLSAIEARARFVPSAGSVGGFFHLRIKRDIARWLLQNSSPVSSKDNPERYGLVGLTRLPIEHAPPIPCMDPEEEHLLRARHRAVAEAVRAAVHPDDHDALEEMLDGRRPRKRKHNVWAKQHRVIEQLVLLRKTWEEQWK